MSGRKFWIAATLLLCLALALRAGAAVWWQGRLDAQGNRFALGDSESYWVLAQQLARGQPYEYGGPDARLFRVPGYPLLLAPWTDPNDAFAGILAARLMGSVLGTAAVALAMLAARDLYGDAAGWIAGALAAVDPGSIMMSVLVLSEAPFCPLMLACLWAWGRAAPFRASPETTQRAAQRRISPPLPRLCGGEGGGEGPAEEETARGAVVPAVPALVWTALGALAAAAAVLVRPSWILFPPAYFALRLLLGRERRRTFGHAVAAGLVIAVVMSPWWIRNYRETDRFVLTTLQVGASLYDGLHPGATGASDTGMEFVQRFMAEQRAADAAATAPPPATFEYRVNQRMTDAALRWTRENPLEALRLAGRKVVKTWSPWPTAAEMPGGWWVAGLFALATLGIVVPGVVGGVQRAGLGPAMVFWLPAVYFTLIHAVFVGSLRYRLPAVLALTVLAAPVFLQWGCWVRSRFRGRRLSTK